MRSPVVVCYGGGVNSLAVLVGMKQRGVTPDAIVFSDTRGEKPETYEHMSAVLAPWLSKSGFPELTMVCRSDFGRGKTGDASLEAECIRLGTLPSRAYGFGTCADKWKIDPFKWWAKSWPMAVEAWRDGGYVTRVIGYDAGEQRRVGASSDKGFAKWFPLIEWGWSRTECVAAIAGEGLRVPPKSACFYCPSSTKSEVLDLQRKLPALYERAIALESRALEGGRWQVKGLGRRYSWKELGEASRDQLALFSESPVESCTICVDGSDDAEDE